MPANSTVPDKLWFHDLQELIKEKIKENHEIIVAGDFNDDLNNTTGVTRTFMMNLTRRRQRHSYTHQRKYYHRRCVCHRQNS